ncbi:ribokinase [Macrococcus armenti]|uniref:ribokinase n=1 Tax=Macrococcus armenti TaxID=2875764 RepID=UPI001CCFF10D|nr:ribokinase [Macrococcus armenti]UBH15821.1 ribokinase [Macrococcus armenti]UBH18180.1 ribokinase [Macrococcus armenti]UBH20447.1 ribokinase [Macrococcus armenti]
MGNIFVIGSASVDLVVKSHRQPAKGETILGESFFMTTGGKGSNQAVSASRLGVDVYMVGAVGDDTFGEMILNNFKENHVNIDNVETVTHQSSGTAHITLADNDNSIIVVPGANFKITIEQVEVVLSKLEQSDIVVIQNEIPVQVTEYIINRTHELGITTIYNPAPFVQIDTSLLNKVSYFTPNETEVRELFGEDFESVIKQYPKQMIVTLGAQGAVYYDGELKRVPGLKAEVVDTTGAGDTFNGAFAVALSEGKDIDTALQFANKAASISVGGLGAQGGMPYRKDMA